MRWLTVVVSWPAMHSAYTLTSTSTERPACSATSLPENRRRATETLPSAAGSYARPASGEAACAGVKPTCLRHRSAAPARCDPSWVYSLRQEVRREVNVG